MIEAFEADQFDAEIFRLANLPRDRLQAVLLRRNIPEESIDEALQSMADIGTPITLADAVSFPFRQRERRIPPFGSGRFHDGQDFGVYYAALEPETCNAEIEFHLADGGLAATLVFPAYYFLIRSNFSGTALNLVGQEVEHPNLITPDRSGYPFCQLIGREAFQAGLAGLQTRSARRPDGVCTPVLTEQAISAHQILRSVRLRNENNMIVVEHLD